MFFLLEPVRQRYAICTSAKVACVSVRMWMWEMSGLSRTTPDIFKEFERYTLHPGQALPESLEGLIAVHRDGVSRMRAVYDHRIRKEREAPDKGLEHFARHLPEYCAVYSSIAHHCRPQSSWLGSDLDIYTDIVPLDQLECLRRIVGEVIGEETPPLPLIHLTSQKSRVSDEARKWLDLWTSHDTAIGWDGKTMRIYESESHNKSSSNHET